MRFSRSPILLLSVVQATQLALAFYIELPTRSEAALPNLLARAPNATATSGLDFNSTVIINTEDTYGAYYINITLGGRQFSVSIDTGGPDLWVAGAVPNAKSIDPTTILTPSKYPPIQIAELTLLGYTVPNQAFLAWSPPEAPEGYESIGLGPGGGSTVQGVINDLGRAPPIYRIFRQDTSLPNFITVLLNRPNDTQETYTGEMTISEVLPLFQNISSQPKVPVSSLNTSQYFSVLLDPDGIIGPNGSAIKTTSNATDAPSHDSQQLQVVFDTGAPFMEFPNYVVDAIYSGAKGAKISSLPVGGDAWVVDCDAELNISFKIGGYTYPIHPLDVTQPMIDDNGNTFCLGTFQYSGTTPEGADSTLDGILGMKFLSNVYLLMNYGDFIDGSTLNTSDPYIQILSTTDPAQAHADFVATRQGLTNTTDSPYFNGSGSSKMSFLQKCGIPIFAVVAVVLCIL